MSQEDVARAFEHAQRLLKGATTIINRADVSSEELEAAANTLAMRSTQPRLPMVA